MGLPAVPCGSPSSLNLCVIWPLPKKSVGVNIVVCFSMLFFYLF